MEKRAFEGLLNSKVKLYCKGEQRYSGFVVLMGEDYLELLDRFGLVVRLSFSDVQQMVILEQPGSEANNEALDTQRP